MAYLLTYFSFLENSKNDSKLKDWINFGIYWKKITFAFAALALALGLWLWPWPWMSLAFALALAWLTVLGLGLDTTGLVNIPG